MFLPSQIVEDATILASIESLTIICLKKREFGFTMGFGGLDAREGVFSTCKDSLRGWLCSR